MSKAVPFYFSDLGIKSVNWLKLILSVGILLLIGVFLKKALFRRKYNALLPSRKIGFFNILGDLIDIPLTKSKRNGSSVTECTLQLGNDHYGMFQKKGIGCFWLGYELFVGLLNARAVEAVLSSTKHNDKAWSYTFVEPLLGTGLLTSNGAKWKSRRKLLTQCFHLGILKDFFPVMNEQAQIVVEKLKNECTKDSTVIQPFIALCNLDIICITTFGVDIGAQKDNNSEYVNSGARIAEILMERAINCLYWPDFIFKLTKLGRECKHHLQIMHNFSKSVIREKKMKYLSGNIDTWKNKRKALLDLLLEHHFKSKDFSEEDIREEVDTFAFAGHHTTAIGIVWTLYFIGLDKKIQNRIWEELHHIFGEDTEREASDQDLNDMKYLECVLKESQRIYPSLPFIGRVIQQDTVVCDYVIPKGATFVIPLYFLHRDKDVFPEPEKFDPDRFLPENSVNRHPYAYIPFSAGPRNCIGQKLAQIEAKIVVSAILRNFTVESLDERETLKVVPDIVLKPTKPIRIKFRQRNGPMKDSTI